MIPAAKTFGEPCDRDWPEDFSHENGQYWCKCYRCEQSFTGHKRRTVCKQCATKPQSEPQP